MFFPWVRKESAKPFAKHWRKGADRAIHVETGEQQLLDALGTARMLAKALATESPELILTGLQSEDLGYGQTGVILAELLGYSHATIVMEVEPEGNRVRVKREFEDGWFQHVTLPLPAVLTIQSGIKKLRYATLMGIKKAKSKPVQTIAAAELEQISLHRRRLRRSTRR